MTDAFESEVQKFVGKQNGGELTPAIVYGMLKAVDHDAVTRHEETVAVLNKHCAEAAVRDQRILDHDAAIRGLRRTFDAQRVFAIVLVICAILVAVACLEFIDQEKFAGIMSLVLTIAVVLGGWYIGSRKKGP